MFCRIDNGLWNILHVQYECENIMQNIVSPAKHCYGFE